MFRPPQNIKETRPITQSLPMGYYANRKNMAAVGMTLEKSPEITLNLRNDLESPHRQVMGFYYLPLFLISRVFPNIFEKYSQEIFMIPVGE
ncbi:hypothetical protein [Novacetimonas sp. GS1]|uniref:hypothetical protein n=1 Tax=Novacetimonas sp. GS1 TaxID=3119990 RepID=UPI002FCCE47D